MGKNKIKRTSIQEIAEKTGVSTATVSRVFNRHPYVSEAVRAKVIEAARKAGYAPTIQTSHLVFGIFVGCFDRYSIDSYTGQMVSALSRKFFDMGCNVQLIGNDNLPYILRNTYSGVVVFNAHEADFFRDMQIPCLSVNDPADGVCNVMINHRESLEIAVEHLVKLGHSRIAFLYSGKKSWGTDERLAGYLSSLEKSGIPEDKELYIPFSSKADIADKIKILLNRKPTALIVEGETNGLIADHALKELNVKIPQELSLISFEDDIASAYMTPAHTTVCQDFEELGNCAAEMLVKYTQTPLRKRVLPKPLIFHNHLIERDSCAPV